MATSSQIGGAMDYNRAVGVLDWINLRKGNTEQLGVIQVGEIELALEELKRLAAIGYAHESIEVTSSSTIEDRDCNTCKYQVNKLNRIYRHKQSKVIRCEPWFFCDDSFSKWEPKEV